MVQIIGEHFAGHGDGGQFLTDEADLAAERKGHLPALHDKPRPLIGLAYEQQFAGDVAGGQRINKLLVGRLAIGGQEHRVGGAGFADAQQSTTSATRAIPCSVALIAEAAISSPGTKVPRTFTHSKTPSVT